MQYTNHYNLNLPEGTDVVNPLVQDNPNYTAIDNALYANKVRVVGNAAEVKSGTVHAITRSDSDIDVIRFTATGNWDTGDTMTVDGTPVSVYLPDGTAPLTGTYVINTEVVAVINGSRVTLYGAQKLPGYTASDVSYDNTGSGLTASDVQGAIDEISGDLAIPSGTTCIGTVISQTEIFVSLDRIFLNEHNIIPTMVTYLDIPGGGTLTTFVSGVTEYMNGIIISFSTFDASAFIGCKARANINFS